MLLYKLDTVTSPNYLWFQAPTIPQTLKKIWCIDLKELWRWLAIGRGRSCSLPSSLRQTLQWSHFIHTHLYLLMLSMGLFLVIRQGRMTILMSFVLAMFLNWCHPPSKFLCGWAGFIISSCNGAPLVISLTTWYMYMIGCKRTHLCVCVCVWVWVLGMKLQEGSFLCGHGWEAIQRAWLCLGEEIKLWEWPPSCGRSLLLSKPVPMS